MRARVIGMAIVVAAAFMGMDVPTAHAQSCFDLWVERNTIYKRAGYFFKTSRAINYLGNAGCRYDDEAELPLSPRQRSQIARILGMERRLGCR
jgi:hypothetical protein